MRRLDGMHEGARYLRDGKGTVSRTGEGPHPLMRSCDQRETQVRHEAVAARAVAALESDWVDEYI